MQTKAQLLLKEGKTQEARLEISKAQHRSTESVHPLINDVFRLLAAETLIASDEISEALSELDSLSSSGAKLRPDLLGQSEQLLARALYQRAPYLSRVHLERAACLLTSIGHRVRSERALSELQSLPSVDADDFLTGVRTSLDRFLALFGTRERPEVLGHEAFSLLTDSQCASRILLAVETSRSQTRILRQVGQPQTDASSLRVSLGRALDGTVELTYTPRPDILAGIVANQIKRLLDELVSRQPVATDGSESSLAWTLGWSTGDGFVFASKAMVSILETARKVAKARISVLITGETGAGKEVLAKTIYDESDRAHMPFVALNCAAIPKELLESQLFGHRKGAFSGAHESFQGVVRAANGGTLLLDEVAELTLDAQAKLLRFLESGEIHPIGESRPMIANVRLLFATNESLDKAVECGRFRPDLYYRIKVISVRVPPLRERREKFLFWQACSQDDSPRSSPRSPSGFQTRQWNCWCSTHGPGTSDSWPTRCGGLPR